MQAFTFEPHISLPGSVYGFKKEMRLRSYINDKDFEYVSKWVSDERIHALWCANLIEDLQTMEIKQKRQFTLGGLS